MVSRRLLSASTLIGDPLVSSAGERLGRIDELFISPITGRIALVAVVPAPDLGLGQKLMVVPWEALTLDSRHEQLTLQTERQRLHDAPRFDPERWPDVADDGWMRGIHDFYGTQPRED